MDNTQLATYLWTWLALLALLGLNLAVSLLDLGPGAWANLAIATLQALLVLSVFMYLRTGGALLRLVAGAGFLWLALLFGLARSDYATRAEDAAMGRAAPVGDSSSRSPSTEGLNR